MKKIYMPSDDKLYEIQLLGINLKKYIEIKTAESLIVDSINNKEESKAKNAYKYMLDNENIVRAICFLYPEEVKNIQIAHYDIELLKQLINKVEDKSIYNLDYIADFNSCATIYSEAIISETIKKLSKSLPNNPEYRFEYKQNDLLDDIFDCKIIPELYHFSTEILTRLVEIEPAYATVAYQDKMNKNTKKELLLYGLNKYYQRYAIDEDYSVFNEENTLQRSETKRLIKAIRRNKFITD